MALVSQLVADGATVYNLSRNYSEKWSKSVKHLPFDVLFENFKPGDFLPEVLHGLAYLPGSINLMPFCRLSIEDFGKDYQINVLGAVNVVQQCLHQLKHSSEASVVLMSTVAASIGMPFHSSIAAAKGAINGLTSVGSMVIFIVC